MKIAILSGKGGTGKTTISTNLFHIAENFTLFDTDIEEPNTHIFLKGDILDESDIHTYYPVVNEKCNLCGKCGDLCKFNAIIPAKSKVIVFKESCHFCGGCKIVCAQNAIEYEKREIGKIYKKSYSDKEYYYGKLNIGELSGVGIISNLNSIRDNYENTITDCPPGTSCSTVEALMGVNYAILVTEPTPFGVSDMKMVVELLKKLKIKFDVIINKACLGDDEIYKYCKSENIEIIGELPFNKEIAKLNSNGKLITNDKKYYNIFKKILMKIENKGSVVNV
ncbi:MAG: ATPase [Fusobacteria bacterium]|nr:ATPase [Fusobacteriota bacterium]